MDKMKPQLQKQSMFTFYLIIPNVTHFRLRNLTCMYESIQGAKRGLPTSDVISLIDLESSGMAKWVNIAKLLSRLLIDSYQRRLNADMNLKVVKIIHLIIYSYASRMLQLLDFFFCFLSFS